MFLGHAHREWLDTMPPLQNPDGTEYPKDEITLYAYRHSYAQRHADAGTPVDVLRELMGHRSLNTTQTYYRVTEAAHPHPQVYQPVVHAASDSYPHTYSHDSFYGA